MQGADVFCERCGTLQPKPEAAASRSAGVLARKVLDAVGIMEARPQSTTEDWLRLCLNCRGYSCPTCWNQDAGVCQTCAPLPEPLLLEPVVEPAIELPEPIAYPAAEPAPFWVTQLEPLVAANADPEPDVVADIEPAPALVAAGEPEAEPEPAVAAEPALEEPLVVAEPLPEPVVVEPIPVDRPTPPRMPVLPLPPPRPANAPVIPLPALPDYPVAPQIAFNAQTSMSASGVTAAPAFEAHMLLVPPPLSAAALANGLRACANCHLTLSARAHFCRRCGTQQAV